MLLFVTEELLQHSLGGILFGRKIGEGGEEASRWIWRRTRENSKQTSTMEK
jgi:hypothetical protein